MIPRPFDRNLRHLVAVPAIVERGSMSAAAAAGSLSQPGQQRTASARSDVQTYFFRRCNMNAKGEARSWTDQLSLSFNTNGPLGTFFSYICGNGTWIARYDDSAIGKEVSVDVSAVNVALNGIGCRTGSSPARSAKDESRTPAWRR